MSLSGEKGSLTVSRFVQQSHIDPERTRIRGHSEDRQRNQSNNFRDQNFGLVKDFSKAKIQVQTKPSTLKAYG